MKNTKKMVYMAVLLALSVVGANIKIQGSIALDALASFLGALILGPIYGGIIGILGHFTSASLSGFPLTLPLHILIGVEMLVIVSIFGYVYGKGKKILAIVIAIVLNGPVATYLAATVASLLGMSFSGTIMFNALVVLLTIAASVNVILAVIIYETMKKTKQI